MDTPVSNAVPPAVSEVEIPARMFFGAKDYAPHANPRTKPTKDQVNVARARGELLGDVHRIHERLAVSIKHVRVADDCGLATSSIDVLLATAEDLLSTIKRLAKTADNAEARYEVTIAQGPAEQTEPQAKPSGTYIIKNVPHSIVAPGTADRLRAAEASRQADLAIRSQGLQAHIDAGLVDSVARRAEQRRSIGGRP